MLAISVCLRNTVSVICQPFHAAQLKFIMLYLTCCKFTACLTLFSVYKWVHSGLLQSTVPVFHFKFQASTTCMLWDVWSEFQKSYKPIWIFNNSLVYCVIKCLTHLIHNKEKKPTKIEQNPEVNFHFHSEQESKHI